MSAVGQIEKKTQQRIIALFQQQLGYDYLVVVNHKSAS